MILITGASGLVGKAIFKFFSRYYQSIGISFSSDDNKFIRLDLTQEKEVRGFFQSNSSISAIIHCAAVLPERHKDLGGPEIYRGNIEILINILKNIRNNVRFVNIGSTGIYDLGGRSRINENSPITYKTFYHLSKIHGEEMLRQFYKDSKNLLNIRISSPYSIEEKSSTILHRFVESALRNNRIEIWGSGKRTQSFVNVDALASVIRDLYEQSIYGDFNYVTSNGISMMKLAKLIKKQIEGLQIIKTGKQDLEENCRTSFDLSRVSRYVTIKDTLERDIAEIIRRFR